MMTWDEWTFTIIILVIILLPPEYDPAIIMREWIDRWGSRK